MEQTPGPGEYEHKDDRGHGVTIEKDSLKEDLKIFPLQDNTLLRAQLEKDHNTQFTKEERPEWNKHQVQENMNLKRKVEREPQLERDSKKESLRIYLLQDNMRSNQESIEGPQYSVGEKRYTKIEQTQAQENMNTKMTEDMV
ncbi:MAG: hypothetical protein IPK55_10995 [Streptococcus sp.]|nr:hypothetical protein [Streptococcus sp.]